MSGIDPADIIETLTQMGLPLVEFPAGHVLIEEDTAGSAAYVLYEGEVSVTQNFRELATLSHPGAMLGEVAAVMGTERTATVTVTKPSQFFVIENLPDFLHQCSPLALLLMKSMAHRLLDQDRHHTGIYIGLKRLREQDRQSRVQKKLPRR
jgi:CRP-like cAMP-binding protein